MSYQVLARKWRPRIFREMVGQEHVLKALINALDHNRLHHAYLFTGTRGVGKTTIARILAKCLNCETGVSSEPCDQCSACREISEGRFVDLIEVDAASRTRVEDTRELMDNVQYAPTRGRYKIYLIDEVHMLSNHSFNALLKTLEEPPEHVKFLLATTDPQKLPVTILSRCLQFNLKNMTPERIVAHLQKVLGEEMVPFDEAALWALARSADGSMRDALSLTDQAIGFGNGKVSETDVRSMLGTIDQQLIERLVGALVSLDAKAVLEAVADFSEHAPDYFAALNDLIGLLHRIAIAQVLPEAVDNSLGDRDQVMRFASGMAAEDVQLFYQMALMGRKDLPLAPEPRAGFEMILLRMLAFKPQGVADVPSQPLVPNTEEGAHQQVPSRDPPSATEADASVKKPHASPESSRALAAIDEVVGKEISKEISKERDETGALQDTPQHRAARDALVGAVAQPGLNVPELKPSGGVPMKPAPTDTVVNVAVANTPDASEEGRMEPSFHVSLASLTPDHWVKLFFVLNIRGVLQSTVANCVLVGIEGNRLNFWLDENKASLYDETHADRLAQHLGDYFNQPVTVAIEPKLLGEGVVTPARHHAERMTQARADALDCVAKEPVVQTLQTLFDAEIVADTIQFPKPSMLQ